MLTTEYRDTKAANVLLVGAYDSLPEAVKPVLLALSVLMNRIGSLPKADRDDLFELLTAWRNAEEAEEQRSIHRAMEEILAQIPITAEALPLDPAKPLTRRRTGWAKLVGSKIRDLREQAGLTQAQLAGKAGLPQPHISRLENAEYTPTNMTLEKIAKALGTQVGNIDPCAD